MKQLQGQLLEVREEVATVRYEKQKQKEAVEERFTALSEINVKIDRFTEDVDFIRSSLEAIAAQLEAKAAAADLKRVSEHVQILCPRDRVEELAAVIDTKATIAAMQEVHTAVQDLANKSMESYALKEDVSSEVQRVEEKLESSLKLHVTSQYFTRVQMELQKTVDLLRLKLDESSNELRQKVRICRDETDRLQHAVGLKASQAQVHELNKVLMLCATNGQVEAVASEVKTVQKTLREFQTQVAAAAHEQESALQRFDEMFLLKANKVDFRELEVKLEAVSKHIDFEKRVDSIEAKVGRTSALCEKYECERSEVKEQLAACTKSLKSLKSEKRDIALIKGTLQDVMSTLPTKADKSQISELQDSKAPTNSVASIAKSLGSMHRLEQLTLVLLQHTIKYLHGSADAKGIEWLLKHAELVAAWGSLYEPIMNEVEPPRECEVLSREGSRTPTRPTTAGLALLTPTRKSRPVTPTSAGRATSFAGSYRRLAKRSGVQPPSLDASLFPS